MTEEMIKQIKKLLFDYTEVYDDKPVVQGLLLLIKDNYVSKDKIRDKIKELESHIWKDGYMTKFDEYAIHYLKELLED